MLNYKIKEHSDKYLGMNGGQHEYTFKGEKQIITQESLEKAPRELQQSFGNFCAKENEKAGGNGEEGKPDKGKLDKGGKPKDEKGEKEGDGEGKPTDEPGKTPKELEVDSKAEEGKQPFKGGSVRRAQKIHNDQVQREFEIKKHIMRWATTEILQVGPLNMPKVFKALITEPHTAFDYRKNVLETKVNLTVMVDTNIGYMERNHWLYNTIIQTASKVKGVNVFHSPGLHGLVHKGVQYDYYTEMIEELPAKMTEKIIVFTQGCGHSNKDQPYKDLKKPVHFCTCFKPKCNCGCDQIGKAERGGQNMYYEIDTVESLATILP